MVFLDHPGPPGEIQGAGSGADKDRTLSCSSDTRTVPGILQKVCYMLWVGCSYFIVLCLISNASWFHINDRYTPNELRYLPLNTALYEPPLDPDLPALDSEPDSDDAEDGKDEKKNKNSSVRHKFFNHRVVNQITSFCQSRQTQTSAFNILYYAPPLVFLHRTVLLEMRLTWRARREEVGLVTSSRAKRAAASLPPTKQPQATR